MSSSSSISVTRLVRKMRNLLEVELGEVWVEGELSNVRHQSSGHVYFSLKDEGGQISAVLFRNHSRQVKTELADGLKVRVFGEVSLYEARGSVQLIVRKIEEDGQGALQKQFEALKAKLHKEGLFDSENKLPLPKLPQSVALITSATGAALQDMLQILQRRTPWIQPYSLPVNVQGKGAEKHIAHAIEMFSEPEAHHLPRVEVLIIGRGGGSLEDLWNFNEEIVARAIAACTIPTISAVGHEIDFTISDFVADLRAPTPSAAVEMLSTDKTELTRHLESLMQHVKRTTQSQLHQANLQLHSSERSLLNQSPLNTLERRLESLSALTQRAKRAQALHAHHYNKQLGELNLRLEHTHPSSSLVQHKNRLHQLSAKLKNTAQLSLKNKQRTLEKNQDLLHALGPQSTFKRGFSISLDQHGKLITSAAQVNKGETFITHLQDGSIHSTRSDEPSTGA